MAISYFSTMRARAGRHPELLAVLRDLVDAAAAEPGTLVYAFHTVDDDPDTVVSYELFADEAAVELHRSSAVVARVVPRLRELTAESSVRRGTPVMGTGLPVS